MKMTGKKTGNLPLTFLTASALILSPIPAKMASDSKRNRGVIEMVLIGWIRAGLMAARASGAKIRDRQYSDLGFRKKNSPKNRVILM